MTTGAESGSWREIRYREELETQLAALRRRREADPSLSAEDLEGMLNNLYIMDGADWGGRGEVQDLSLQASIAACEIAIAELRRPG